MRQLGGPAFFIEGGKGKLNTINFSVETVTDTETVVKYNDAVQCQLINDGAETVYYYFDSTVSVNDTVGQLFRGESKIYYGSFQSIHLICEATKTTPIRLEVR